MTEIRSLTDDYAVAPQIDAADMARIAARGFKSVICNRPDHEDPDQPTVAEIGRAAAAAGLNFRHVPVPGSGMTPDHVIAQGSALAELPGPVLAYCRSGARCAQLHRALRRRGG